MTNKQTPLTTADLLKTAVGFENLLDELHLLSKNSCGYPPYNISSIYAEPGREDRYEITLAVAGFTKKDIKITVENSHLIINGSTDVLVIDDRVMLHQGIAARNFRRVFRLERRVSVLTATLKDGILTILLIQALPEEIEPDHIQIQ